MPELPDITNYVEALEETILDKALEQVQVLSVFLVRSVDVPLDDLRGRRVLSVKRLGKRIVLGFAGDLFLVLHLMIAGRLRWRTHQQKPPGKTGLAIFDFENGRLLLTEASSKKRASIHIARGREQVRAFDPGGLEVLECSLEAFKHRLRSENHTLKRSLTDPRLLSGIGNAYSDEILHRSGLSPIKLSQKLDDREIEKLFTATRAVLSEWTERLREERGARFPEKVTAFHPQMAVHGRYQKPCPQCETPIQRIRYAENETNYCPTCQTGGRLLADRAMSRLLKGDWPRTLDELENQRAQNRGERQRRPETERGRNDSRSKR